MFHLVWLSLQSATVVLIDCAIVVYLSAGFTFIAQSARTEDITNATAFIIYDGLWFPCRTKTQPKHTGLPAHLGGVSPR